MTSHDNEAIEEARAALRDAEAALQHALDDKAEAVAAERQRLAELAHEINTPLNALLGYAHIMSEQMMGPLDNPTYLEQARIIYHAAMHLQSVCEGILSVASADAEPEIAISEVDVAEMIDGVIELFRGMADQRGIELAANVAADFPRLQTDPRRLHQIIINLVSNAIKFTPSGGNVAVQAVVNDQRDAMIFIVADNGPGVAAEKLYELRKPFKRGMRPSPHGDHGTGLGLSIAARLANEILGDLWLASEEGIGTLAIVELPISFEIGRSKKADAAIILDGKSLIDFVPYRSIHKPKS